MYKDVCVFFDKFKIDSFFGAVLKDWLQINSFQL